MSEVLKALELTAEEMRAAHAMNPEDWPLAPVEDKPYEWFTAPGGLVRARCREHGGQMSWQLTMSHKYPGRPNKHDDRVWHTGHILQVYRCAHEGCGTEAVA